MLHQGSKNHLTTAISFGKYDEKKQSNKRREVKPSLVELFSTDAPFSGIFLSIKRPS
jgi:hypothetical protein